MAPLASPAAAQRGTTQAQASRADTGTTTIPAKVVAKIAAEAAYETGNVGSNAGGVPAANFPPAPKPNVSSTGK